MNRRNIPKGVILFDDCVDGVFSFQSQQPNVINNDRSLLVAKVNGNEETEIQMKYSSEKDVIRMITMCILSLAETSNKKFEDVIDDMILFIENELE